MSLNWIFGFVAIGVWIAASLLYLRGPIMRRIAEWREQRAAGKDAAGKK